MDSEAGGSLSSRPVSSRLQARLLLWVGFGGLLLLMAILGLSAISFLYQIEIRQEWLRQDYVERDRALERLRSSIYLSGTYVRDFLLAEGDPLAAGYKTRFLDTWRQIEAGIVEYRRLLRPGERPVFEALTRELSDYQTAVQPVLTWTPEQKQQRGRRFMQEQLLPRRMSAIGLAGRIQELTEKQLEAGSQDAATLFSGFRAKLILLLVLSASIGLALAGATLWRLMRLERESDRRFGEVLQAREEMQRLSAELLSAQESERRRISRELHDEVGQLLSAIMLGLGNLRSSLGGGNHEESLRQLQLIQDMTERNASVVRNISLLLRPSMLDDLGLLPALKWLGREVSRSSRLQVEVVAADSLGDLPEDHRTCVYRVVQEALNNAVRHSGALQARVQVARREGRLKASIQDDGRGFLQTQGTGLGILGMEERVVGLGGTFDIRSGLGQGTAVSFELPLPEALNAAGYETSPLRTA